MVTTAKNFYFSSSLDSTCFQLHATTLALCRTILSSSVDFCEFLTICVQKAQKWIFSKLGCIQKAQKSFFCKKKIGSRDCTKEVHALKKKKALVSIPAKTVLESDPL